MYRLNYRVNGVRRRQVVGTNKREAELIQASIENELFRGIDNVPSQKKIISFTKLVDEYFSIKANNLSDASVTRYKEYLKQFNYFFSKYFQTAFKDITLIKDSHIAESIDFLTSRGTSEGRIW